MVFKAWSNVLCRHRFHAPLRPPEPGPEEWARNRPVSPLSWVPNTGREVAPGTSRLGEAFLTPPLLGEAPVLLHSHPQCPPRFSFPDVSLHLLVISFPAAWPVLRARITIVGSSGNIFHKVTVSYFPLKKGGILFIAGCSSLSQLRSETGREWGEKYRIQQRSQIESQLNKTKFKKIIQNLLKQLMP